MEAGAAADEIIETCFGTDDDRDRWKTKLKTHFAQCWRAYERDFAN